MDSKSENTFKLKAINFDNEREIDCLLGLMQSDKEKASGYRMAVQSLLKMESVTKDAHAGLISIAVFYNSNPVAHAGLVPGKNRNNASIVFTAFDEKFASVQSKLNTLLWQKISCLASRHGWSELGFADAQADQINHSMNIKQFCEKEAQILPLRTLQESIETIVETEDEVFEAINLSQFSEELSSL